MKDEDQATGGYVVCGKPYIIGDRQDDWNGIFPQKPLIEIKADMVINEDITAMIKEAIKTRIKISKVKDMTNGE